MSNNRHAHYPMQKIVVDCTEEDFGRTFKVLIDKELIEILNEKAKQLGYKLEWKIK